MKYERNLKDLKDIQKNGYKVFSCFSCGGWSSMGYKNAWYEILWTCEIDPQMDKVYQTNFKTKYHYVMGVQDFKNLKDIPEDLFDIDLLDWSPPCSTFSMAWLREKARWKEKVFREGQAKQVLSDLFFDYLDLVERIKPKVVVAENVKGMTLWKAKGYLKMIFQRFREIWYNVQLFLLNGATMGLPQRRERIFFCAYRKEFNLPKLKLDFNEKPILFKEIKHSELNDRPAKEPKVKTLLQYAKYGDWDLSEACKRYEWKENFFTHNLIYDHKVCNTITARDTNVVRTDKRYLNNIELKLVWSYPLDYNFLDVDPSYLIWMSVPPLMMYRVSKEIQKQRLDLIYKK